MRQLENKVAEGQSAPNALSKHGKNTGHRIDWDSASVIAVETRLSTCPLLESQHTQSTHHTVKRKRSNPHDIYCTHCAIYSVHKPLPKSLVYIVVREPGGASKHQKKIIFIWRILFKLYPFLARGVSAEH